MFAGRGLSLRGVGSKSPPGLKHDGVQLMRWQAQRKEKNGVETSVQPISIRGWQCRPGDRHNDGANRLE